MQTTLRCELAVAPRPVPCRRLREGPSFDLVYRHGLDVDAAGERLAMGSTTGNLWVGADGGASWTLVSTHLPPIAQVVWAPED